MQVYMLLAVGFGGFVGAILRYILSNTIQKNIDSLFPFGTLSVNVIGSFLIGFLALYFNTFLSPHQKAFFIVGVLGSLTTFSTFSLQTLEFFENGQLSRGLINIGLNVFVTLVAVFLGMMLFKKMYG